MKYKTIYSTNCAFGGHECYVTSNGVTVCVRHRYAPASSTFRTVARMTVAEWDEFYESNGLHDPYKQDPSVLIRAFV